MIVDGTKRKYQLGRVLGQGSFGKVYFSPPNFAIKQITIKGKFD